MLIVNNEIIQNGEILLMVRAKNYAECLDFSLIDWDRYTAKLISETEAYLSDLGIQATITIDVIPSLGWKAIEAHTPMAIATEYLECLLTLEPIVFHAEAPSEAPKTAPIEAL